jgi:hypothetical protein
MTFPRFAVLSLLVVMSACAACGPGNLPEESERVQQGAECPEGCLVLESSRDEMKCEADDPECCDWSDPTCADGGTGGGGDGGTPTGACHPSAFMGFVFADVETTMNACYGHWRYRTSSEVSYCPSAPDSWSCASPVRFGIDGGGVIWIVAYD